MADSSFGLKIDPEGEREFKRAITDINREMRVSGSEMKLVASQFDKNDKSASALTARNQVLGKEIEAQKSKIQTLKSDDAKTAAKDTGHLENAVDERGSQMDDISGKTRIFGDVLKANLAAEAVVGGVRLSGTPSQVSLKALAQR